MMKLFFIIAINIPLILLSQKQGKDSIQHWLELSKNKKTPLKDRTKFLNKAYLINLSHKNSKVKSSNSSLIAYQFYRLKDTTTFKKVNYETLKLAKKLKDSFTIADAHWSFGDFFNDNEKFDEAFYHYNLAYEIFEKIQKKYESARMLYAMGYIKGRFKDYNGGEILTFKAIKKFKQLKNNKYLYTAYNNLGVLQKDIKEYQKALFYYNKSLTFYDKIKKKEKEYLGTYNNIANIYVKLHKFKTAIDFYNKELAINPPPSHYARVLDNKAYCKLLIKDTTGIKKNFFTALKIRDSLKNKSGVLMSKTRISDYYAYAKDTNRAIKYAKEANTLAKKLKNGRDYLTTLKQLSNLEPKNSKKYLERYIEYNDSLITIERKAQNKFTRIEFETDEHIEDKERLSQQLIWSIGGSLSIILISTLLYFLRVQKVKNEKLQLEADQQKANEEVYILTLQQQAKLEEERVKERNRISAELHDGILGKLFGTRVNLGFLGMQMNNDTQEKQQAYLDELQDIEKEIREVSHKLSDNFNDANVNFTTIISQLLEDKGTIGDFLTHFENDDTIIWSDISEITKANVYRIIQEALQNIIKHANAKNVTLAFSLENEKLAIQITDDGVGFDTKKSKKGIGIKNINSRIAKLQGNVSFISELNTGTTLQIKIPIT